MPLGLLRTSPLAHFTVRSRVHHLSNYILIYSSDVKVRQFDTLSPVTDATGSSLNGVTGLTGSAVGTAESTAGGAAGTAENVVANTVGGTFTGSL